ncbi:uncharacterized protein [Montipora capricornis]|uniref:uncharacterized protein isoform X2 n=2 Tax=Montipora capricornis TaxID=246305 RepID=UPI0035F10F84
MLLKGFSIFNAILISATLYLKKFSVNSKHVGIQPSCHLLEISCSCMQSYRLELNVTVKLCADEDAKSACNQKPALEECRKKAYSQEARQKRGTASQDFHCKSGSMSPSLQANSSTEPILKVDAKSPAKVQYEGNDVTFECLVHTSLPANVTWFYNGKLPMENLSDTRHSYFECKTILQLKMVKHRNKGNYSCVVKTSHGKASAFFHLTVVLNKGPYIRSLKMEGGRGHNTAVIGSNVNLTCESQNSKVENFFQKNGSVIDENKHYIYYHSADDKRDIRVSVLEIRNVSLEDAGNYTCIAYLAGNYKGLSLHLNVVPLNIVHGDGGDKNQPSFPDDTSNNRLALGVALGTTIVAVLAMMCICKKWLLPYIRARLKTNNQSSTKLLDTRDQTLKGPPEVDYEAIYDVFICYSNKDATWVKELLAELEKRHFTCCIDFRDFVPGAAIVDNISQAIYYSRKTIAVLSPDFVNSNWCNHELKRALTRIRSHQVVPIVYRKCAMPLALRDRTYLDWESCDVKPYFWEHLERALKHPKDEGMELARLGQLVSVT